MLCLVSTVALAQPAPPGVPPHRSVQTADYRDVMREAAALHRARRFNDALALLSNYENEFAGEPLFDYQLGIAALEAGRPAIAQQALERAVLVRPDFAGAWVDLALAHARLGESEVAQQIVSHVEQSFDVPQPLRDQLRGLRAELVANTERARQLLDAWQGVGNGYVHLSAGHDSNANLGLASSIFTLTPIGGLPLQVTIPPAARAAADSFFQLRADWQRALHFGEEQRARVYFSGQYKEFDVRRDYSLGEAALGYTHEIALPKVHGWAVEGIAAARTITLGGNSLVSIATAGVGLVAYEKACRWGVRIAGESRNYTLSGYVDADVPSLSASAACRGDQSQTTIVVSIARDDPRLERAGGRTDRIELGLHHARQIAARHMVIAFLGGSYNADAKGYSNLLANGAERRLIRTSARLAWFWEFSPGHPGWLLHAEIEHLRDSSNLDIFNVSSTRTSLGLRYQY